MTFYKASELVNYLVASELPTYLTKHQIDKLRSEAKYYIWDDPYFWRLCGDQVIRCCVHDFEIHSILHFCHSLASGGHFGPQRTTRQVLDCGFYWPTLFHDAWVIFLVGMRYPNNPYYFVKYLMYGHWFYGALPQLFWLCLHYCSCWLCF